MHQAILARGVEAWNAWRIRHAPLPVDLASTSFGELDLSGVNLSGCDLAGVAVAKTVLRSAMLIGADLSSATADAADLSDTYLTDADLSGVRFQGINLNGADLRYAQLSEARLIDCDLIGANLSGATLDHADLEFSALIYADFSNAVLAGANLTACDLRHTIFRHSDFGAVRLSKVVMQSTVIDDSDLRGAVGLDTVIHRGPSAIGLNTIYRSQGKIPESFLRGAGLPENFIAYMRSLTGTALDFYSVFISYSAKDQEFADRIYADLQAEGVRCWFAPHDIRGGKKIHEQIDEAVNVYDKLLLILSDTSMNSKWVKTEIANARAKEEKQKRQVLFPISVVPFDRIKAWKLFDADTGIDSAREIREYYIPDFSNWKDHDSYVKAFERLVRDLKPVPAKPVLGTAP